MTCQVLNYIFLPLWFKWTQKTSTSLKNLQKSSKNHDLQNVKKMAPKKCNLWPARSWITFFYLTKAQFGSNGPKKPQHHSKIFKNHRKTMTFKMWRKWRPKNVIYDLPGPELHFSTSQKLNLVQMDPKNLNITQFSSKIFKNHRKKKDVCCFLTNIFWFESPKYEEHGAQKYHKISYWITFEIFYTITAYLR